MRKIRKKNNLINEENNKKEMGFMFILETSSNSRKLN